MKSESLVIVNHHVTVNDLSNFAHTAHHARRVVPAGHLSVRYDKHSHCRIGRNSLYLGESVVGYVNLSAKRLSAIKSGLNIDTV